MTGALRSVTGAVLVAARHTPRGAGADPLAFHLHGGAWLGIVALALAYTWGLRAVARSSGPAGRLSRRQLGCLGCGFAALVLALTWPLADLAAHWSLTALVVQRLLLTLAAAPLLLLAAPSPLLGVLTRPAPIDACVEFLTRPVVAVVSFTAVAIGTLLTPAVAAQASSAWWRAATDVALLAGGAVLWGPALRHLPGAHRTSPVGLAGYLFVQSVVPTFPAVIYVFARHPLYPAFAGAHEALGLSRLVDQQLAGVVAKVATLPVLWSAAWAALARAQRLEAAGVDDEPLTWAEVERQLERVARAERRRHPSLLQRLRAGPAGASSEGRGSQPAAPRSPADGPGPLGT